MKSLCVVNELNVLGFRFVETAGMFLESRISKLETISDKLLFAT